MSEYISRDTINQILSDRIDMNDKCLNGSKENKQFEEEKYFFTLIFEDEQIKSLIEESDPADVRENIHGHWEVVSDGYGDKAYICECSECKDTVWVYKDTDRKWNYCPNCGADMRGDKAE